MSEPERPIQTTELEQRHADDLAQLRKLRDALDVCRTVINASAPALRHLEASNYPGADLLRDWFDAGSGSSPAEDMTAGIEDVDHLFNAHGDALAHAWLVRLALGWDD